MSLAPVLEAPVRVAEAIAYASRATGADFGYLLKTAARESNFKLTAKARSSSATGLFQFIDSTWLETMKDAGDRFGLGKYADCIVKTEDGHCYVPNPRMRREILKLRNDPQISAVMAGAFTRQNAEYIESKIGREPTQGELYIGHFMGARGGARMIALASSRPNERADGYFPKAARANRAIFYSKGRPRSLAEVYRVLVAKHNTKQVVSSPLVEPPRRNPVAAAELEAVSGEPEKGVPMPQRKLALGRPAGGPAPLGSVGRWIAIIQDADAPAGQGGAAVRPVVAGWRRRITDAESATPGAVGAPPAARSAMAGTAEAETGKTEAARGRSRFGRLRSSRGQQPLRRAAETARQAKTRDEIIFENFFQHLARNG